MAESAIDVPVNPSTSCILTEEMIDAEMSKRLNMLQEEIESSYGRQGDHNYCIDDDCDDVDSSDNDLHVVSVIDSDSSHENQVAQTTSHEKFEENVMEINVGEWNDDAQNKAELMTSNKEQEEDVIEINIGEQKDDDQNKVKLTTSNEKRREKVIEINVGEWKNDTRNKAELRALDKNQEKKFIEINMDEQKDNDQNKVALTTSNKKQDEKGVEINSGEEEDDGQNSKVTVTVTSPDSVELEKETDISYLDQSNGSCKDANESTSNSSLHKIHSFSDALLCKESFPGAIKNSSAVLINSLDETMRSNMNCPKLVDLTTESQKISTGNLKQSLTVKPIKNLVKDDLNIRNNNVKVFKCVEGQLELFPSCMKKSNVKDLILTNPTSSDSNVEFTEDFGTTKNKSVFDKNEAVNHCERTIFNDNSTKSQKGISRGDYISLIKKGIVLQTQKDSSIKCNEISTSLFTVDKSSSSNSENIKIPVSINDANRKEFTKKNAEVQVSSNKSANVVVNKIESIISENNSCDSMNFDPVVENSSEKNESTKLPVFAQIVDNNCNSSQNKVTNKPVSKQVFQRRQILPKINYRYHIKDKLIVSDALPKKNNVMSLGKNKDNVIILPDGTNVQPLLIMSPDKIVSKNNTGTGLNSPHNNPPSVKYFVNKFNTNAEETQSKKTVDNPSKPQPVLLKDKCGTGKIWEKVDRFSLSNESIQQSLEELAISSLKSQLLEREVPPYKPVDSSEFYTCLDCSDRFVLESSLRNHRFRKSVLIKYWCRTCSCLLNMYNRCMFLAHIRSHSQLVKNLDMSSLSIEPLPKSLIRLGTNDEVQCDNPQYTISTSPILISVNSSVDNTRHSTIMTMNKKPVSSSIVNSNTVPIKNPCRDLRVETVSKIVPLDFISTNNKSKETVPVNNNDDVVNDDDDTGNSDDSVERVDSNSDVQVLTPVTDSNPDTSNVDIIPVKNSSTPAEENTDVSVSNCVQEMSHINGISIETPESSDVSKENHSLSDKQSEPQARAKSKGKRTCPECSMPMTAKCSVRKHLQSSNRPGDSSLKCNVCRLILPTKCALKMHLRIHMKLKPFRCPECAIEFHIYDRFLMHLKYTCCHLSKVVRYVCTLCGNMQLSLAALEQHLLTRHVRPIFKCGNCPVAFVTLKSVDKHKEKAHPGMTVPTNSYQQCRLCPEKLIPKKRFLTHLKGHINDDRLCIYAYQCPTCKNTFFQRTELIYHRMQCDTRDGIIRSCLTNTPPISPSGDNDIQEISFGALDNDGTEKEIILPCKKRKVMNDDEIEVVEEEQDPLSLEGFQAQEEPLKEPLIELCVVCKKEKVVILPGEDQSSQSLCCKKCVRPCGMPQTSNSIKQSSDNKNKLQAAKLKCYKCKICKSGNSMDLKLTYEHFKTYHRELEGQSINEWLIIENKNQQMKRSNIVTAAETIKEKYKKKKISLNTEPVTIKKENIDEDDKEPSITPEKKKTKRFTKPKHKILEGNSFESGQIINCEDTKMDLMCSKCDFVASSKEELRDHVACHRTDPNALQCLECGECFVVLPSLEKHLIINHRISNVDNYIMNNKQYIDGSAGQNDTIKDDTDKGEADFTCKVCHEIFESKTVLDKHFRSHGMAFLFKNMSQ